MKVMVIAILMGALGTIPKGLVKEVLEIGGWVETIQTTEYWEESWRHEETCCHSDSSEWPSANADGKNSQGVIS